MQKNVDIYKLRTGRFLNIFTVKKKPKLHKQNKHMNSKMTYCNYYPAFRLIYLIILAYQKFNNFCFCFTVNKKRKMRNVWFIFFFIYKIQSIDEISSFCPSKELPAFQIIYLQTVSETQLGIVNIVFEEVFTLISHAVKYWIWWLSHILIRYFQYCTHLL